MVPGSAIFYWTSVPLHAMLSAVSGAACAAPERVEHAPLGRGLRRSGATKEVFHAAL